MPVIPEAEVNARVVPTDFVFGVLPEQTRLVYTSDLTVSVINFLVTLRIVVGYEALAFCATGICYMLIGIYLKVDVCLWLYQSAIGLGFYCAAVVIMLP